MRVRRSLLLLLLAVLIASAKSSAFRAAPIAATVHQGHANHNMAYAAQSAQQLQASLAQRTGPRIPVAIDGAVNPELISDSIAYRHFIRATASSKSVADVQRREAFMEQAGLMTADRLAVVQALGNVAAELDAVKQQRNIRGPSIATAELQQLKSTEDQALSMAQMRLQSGLSATGAAKLDAYIQQHVKRRIKIYTFAMK